MKKTVMALVATVCLVACGNVQKSKQQTSGTDSTAVAAEDQIVPDVPEETGVIEESDGSTFDLGTGVFTCKGVRYEFAYVKGGTFMMGAAEDDEEAEDYEKPAHQVTLDSYYIGKTEVTYGFWKAVMGSYPSDEKFPDNFPVQYVSWEDCQKFVFALFEKYGGELVDWGLPTEAEWEFAARGGNKSRHYKYSGSDNLYDVARDGDAENGPYEVAARKPNELGIYDMSGNVAEWCKDMYGSYSGEAQTNPCAWYDKYGTYVLRGGHCFMDSSFCRVTARYANEPDIEEEENYGFRLVFRHYAQEDD